MYKNSAKEYSQVSLQTEVMEADPHKLIQLLLEGALTRLAVAKSLVEQGDAEGKNEKLGNVVDIICSLQESLDYERGGEIAKNLERLYDYMTRRIWDANRLNDVDIINEVMGLLMEVKSGWEGIRNDYLEKYAKENVQGAKSGISV